MYYFIGLMKYIKLTFVRKDANLYDQMPNSENDFYKIDWDLIVLKMGFGSVIKKIPMMGIFNFKTNWHYYEGFEHFSSVPVDSGNFHAGWGSNLICDITREL